MVMSWVNATHRTIELTPPKYQGCKVDCALSPKTYSTLLSVRSFGFIVFGDSPIEVGD
ncbi:hypothetical protein KIN20_009389 [Parelaphostrongylus tenuis]|uniref:Uncharacterized protein n=1 Tax=Parelaphostrongylus tenuis TaxID=148309 RepID=A0AAD5MRR2_PARTN|nr:hypothetical protein KIN20_009389 [Parelaphostrongylus tenuis]